MITTLFSDILNGQLKSVLIAENRLVFRSVIHKQAFNIAHQRNCPHICYENYNPHYTLDSRLPDIAVSLSENEIGNLTRKPHEQEECKRKADNSGNNTDNSHHLRSEMIGEPTVKL